MEWTWEGLKQLLKDVFIDCVNTLIEVLAQFIKMIASILPNWDLTLDVDTTIIDNIVGVLNWCFPVHFAIQCITFFGIAVISYFTIGILMRWAKISN